MNINEALVEHYHESIIPFYTLKDLVAIPESYLMEKPTWYKIDGDLKYFKVRGDLRLFAEVFFSAFAREVIGLDTLDYEVAHVRTLDSKIKPDREERKIGLLSTNFQTKDNHYYLISELENSEFSDLTAYGEYSLVNLLTYLDNLLTKENYQQIKEFLLKLFVADAFTLQVDRNHNNICFQIPKIDGVRSNQRLRPEIIQKLGKASGNVVVENGISKISGFVPSKVYDSERIFGIDHKNEFVHTPGDVWIPLFPYSPDFAFKGQEEAREAREIYDGCDPNLFELVSANPSIRPMIERLAYGDEYRGILERFCGTSQPVNLYDHEQEFITEVIEERREAFKRVLTI